MHRRFYRESRKCIIGRVLVIPALVTLLPVPGALAVLVRRKLGAPILFRQQRLGLHGKPFTLYKFRTMTDARDAAGNLLPDAGRVTRLNRRRHRPLRLGRRGV